jgi:DNA-binding NtrC family response regulator
MSYPTIVCIDDEQTVLLTLRTQLMRYFPGYAIEIAESGGEALTLVEELLAEGVEIPLVIADQIMPGMKGDQVLIELHARYPQILKVMLTGQARAEDVGNAVNRGNLYRFLAKPWSDSDLQLTISEALLHYQQEQQLAQDQLELELAINEVEALNALLEP